MPIHVCMYLCMYECMYVHAGGAMAVFASGRAIVLVDLGSADTDAEAEAGMPRPGFWKIFKTSNRKYAYGKISITSLYIYASKYIYI